MNPFWIGQDVVTRRGKRGTVTAIDGDTVTVRFGGREFPMRSSQLISASVYDRMGKGYARQQYQ